MLLGLMVLRVMGMHLRSAKRYGSKLPSQSFTTTQLEAQRTTCAAVSQSVGSEWIQDTCCAQFKAIGAAGNFFSNPSVWQMRPYQDIQQHQTFASCSPLPEIYNILQLVDSCYGSLKENTLIGHTPITHCIVPEHLVYILHRIYFLLETARKGSL